HLFLLNGRKFAVVVVDIALRLLELAREEGAGVLGHCLAKLEIFFQQHGRKPTTDVLRFLRAACRKVHIKPWHSARLPRFLLLSRTARGWRREVGFYLFDRYVGAGFVDAFIYVSSFCQPQTVDLG